MFARNPTTTTLILRIGLVVVFAYAAVSQLLQPYQWTGYIPSFATSFMSLRAAVAAMAVYELLLVAWLVSGKYLRYAALASALTLAGIVSLNLGQLAVTFRDVGLIFAAVALFFLA